MYQLYMYAIINNILLCYTLLWYIIILIYINAISMMMWCDVNFTMYIYIYIYLLTNANVNQGSISKILDTHFNER